jgi:hypothetical protein
MNAPRTGVLVVRVWTEAGAPELRARLIETQGLDGGTETKVAAAGVDGICDAVRRWLEAVATRDAVRDVDVTPG